jgi:DNA repair exonuclease SbcCD nuclease subunit
MENAKERAVEAVLIPGDLWDDETVSQESVHKLVESFASIDPIPVFIAPGNHDFCSPLSKYSREMQVALGMQPWSDNVFIFEKPDFACVFHPWREDVVVVGRAFLENVKTSQRLLGTRIARPSRAISLLLFHGSLEGYNREGATKVTAPFSSEELLAQDFSYTALGHYHSFSQIVDANGKTRAAYAGSTGARMLSDDGPRYVLIGSVDSNGLVGEFEKIELDPRRICALNIDVSGASSAEIVARIEENALLQQWRPVDMVAVTLSGRVHKGANVQSAEQAFQDRYFHFKLFDRTLPDYDLDNYDRRTVEGRFKEEMKKEIDSAESDERRQLLERALYYGLDGFRGVIKPTYED